jgi:hypothetical protein
MSTPEPRFPARFDAHSWDEDLARTTPAGRQAAEAARRDYEADGIPASHLKPCDEEGRDGNNLPQCVKAYLPQPNGRFGIVFEAVRIDRRLRLEYIAFGVRHHPKDSHAATVYELAHQRLNEDSATPGTGHGTPS